MLTYIIKILNCANGVIKKLKNSTTEADFVFFIDLLLALGEEYSVVIWVSENGMRAIIEPPATTA